MRRKFYTAHEDGTDAAIYVIYADNEQQIFQKYPALHIFYPSKPWLKAHRKSEFKESDIDEDPDHLEDSKRLPARSNPSAAALLLPFDPLLEEFAQAHNVTLSDVTGVLPRRSLTWSDLYFPFRRLYRRRIPILCVLQILLEDSKEMTWSFRARAAQYRKDGPYAKQLYLKHSVPIDEIADELPELLNDAWTRVSRWSGRDLRKGP